MWRGRCCRCFDARRPQKQEYALVVWAGVVGVTRGGVRGVSGEESARMRAMGAATASRETVTARAVRKLNDKSILLS